MRLNMRIVGKCGFLLAVMGFFMPVACDKNAFQLIEYANETNTALMIVLFILAIIGCIIGFLLLMKKDVTIAVDWVVVLASIGIGIGLLSQNELRLQYGAYVMITGFSVAFIFVLIASLMSDSNFSSKKKCPFCGNEVNEEAIVCQFCGKDLPNEFVPTHKVKLLTNSDGMSLRSDANPNIGPFKKIPDGTEIQHISTGGKVNLGDVKGQWYKIKTRENIYGWCFSGSLEKI